jgi:hypothetical protein
LGTISARIADLREHAEVRLVRRGGVAAREQVGGDGEIAFQLGEAPQADDWYRVEAWRRGSRMLLAITNPRYVD